MILSLRVPIFKAHIRNAEILLYFLHVVFEGHLKRQIAVSIMQFKRTQSFNIGECLLNYLN